MDHLIIGGGPAGASLAVRLASAGKSVHLFERECGPHDKVCGEFLSFEAAAYLGELGVDIQSLGGVDIAKVEILGAGSTGHAILPFRAYSLSRRTMDEALLARAADAGAVVERGRRVTRLERIPGGWQVQSSDRRAFSAEHVFLATGKHDVHGWKRPPGRQTDLIGFKQHWTLSSIQTRCLQGRVELHLFAGGYAGLEPIEGGQANLCLVVRRSTFKALGSSWDALFKRLLDACPGLAVRLTHATASSSKPLAIGSIPYGYVQKQGGGPWRLGDQAAVIPSFAGEGMSIAMHSARLASEVFLSGGAPKDYQIRLARDVERQVLMATWASRALVLPWSQELIAAMISSCPSIAGYTALATRIPRRALV